MKSEPDAREVKSLAWEVAGMVAGTVRSRLYAEAMMPNGDACLAVHTDGAILPGDVSVSPADDGPGHWRIKARADRMLLLSPQFYHYTSGGRDWYVVSGIPSPHRRAVFERMSARFHRKGGGVRHAVGIG